MDSTCMAAVGEYLNKNALNRARFNYQLPIMAGPKEVVAHTPFKELLGLS